MVKIFELEHTWKKIAIGIVVMGFLMPIVSFLYFYGLTPLTTKNSGDLGPVSDWVGGLTIPCFTLASFIILFLAYKAQKEELRLTREQFEKQTKLIDKQKFEGTFFNLLPMFREHTVAMETAITNVSNIISERLGLINMYPSMTDETESVKKLIEEYSIERRIVVALHVYFRLFVYLITFIENAEAIEDSEKEDLFKLLEATMSEDELLIVFAECLSKNSGDPFIEILKKRRFLEHYLNHRQQKIPTFMRDSFIVSQYNYNQG